MYTFLISIPVAFIITVIAVYAANSFEGATLKDTLVNALKLNDNFLIPFGMACVLINLIVCVIVGVSTVGWLEPVDETHEITKISERGCVYFNEDNEETMYIKGRPKPIVVPIEDNLKSFIHEKSDIHNFFDNWTFFMVERINCSDTLFINRHNLDKVQDYYK